MTIGQFLERSNCSETVFLYDLTTNHEIEVDADDMIAGNIDDSILDAEVHSWDYKIHIDQNGKEKPGARLCLNYLG